VKDGSYRRSGSQSHEDRRLSLNRSKNRLSETKLSIGSAFTGFGSNVSSTRITTTDRESSRTVLLAESRAGCARSFRSIQRA
jgi:hypothetical protein